LLAFFLKNLKNQKLTKLQGSNLKKLLQSHLRQFHQ
jgi:hypothetical protein